MLNDIELKPCPFCGGVAAIHKAKITQTRFHNPFPTHYKVVCTKCGGSGTMVEVDPECIDNTWWQRQAEKAAINAWNNRVTDNAD
jgi:DnaJ-class molecular chaperone